MREQPKFDPFGEAVAMAEPVGSRERSSKWLMRTGTGVFWSLVIVIVLARAVYFEPGVFNGLDRAIAFVQGVLAAL